MATSDIKLLGASPSPYVNRPSNTSFLKRN
ncbi:hypothetical protein CsSME_00021935 [Camellia sinensis var. sinensis]